MTEEATPVTVTFKRHGSSRYGEPVYHVFDGETFIGCVERQDEYTGGSYVFRFISTINGARVGVSATRREAVRKVYRAHQKQARLGVSSGQEMT